MSLHDDLLARLQSRFDDSQRTILPPHADIAAFDLVVRLHDINEALPLLLSQRLFGNEQLCACGPHLESNTHKQAGGQHAINIGKPAANLNRTGRRADAIVNQINDADVRKPRLIRQTQQDLHVLFTNRLHFLLANESLNFEHRSFVDVEVRVNGIERHNRREHRGIGGHEIADGDSFAAGPSRDGSRHFGEVHIEFGACQTRFIRLDGRRSHTLFGDCQVEFRLGVDPLFSQRLLTFEIGLGSLDLRLGVGQQPVIAIHLGGIDSRVNLEQQISRLHFAACLEMNGIEVATDSRPNLDRFHRLGSPGELGKVRQLPFHRLGHRHGRYRSGWCAPRHLLIATRVRHEQADNPSSKLKSVGYKTARHDRLNSTFKSFQSQRPAPATKPAPIVRLSMPVLGLISIATGLGHRPLHLPPNIQLCE